MRNILFALFLSGFSTVVLAEAQLRLDGGYTQYNLGALKDNLTYIKSSQAKLGAKILTDAPNYNALYVELGYDYFLSENFTVGPEVGYVLGSESSLETDNASNGGYNYQVQSNPSLLPVLLRVGYISSTEAKRWNYGALLGAGYGLAAVAYKYGVQDTSSSFRFSNIYGGWLPILDLTLKGGYRVGAFGIGATLGYRYAYLAEVKAAQEVKINGVSFGDTINDANGSPLPLDLSGLKAGLDFSLIF